MFYNLIINILYLVEFSIPQLEIIDNLDFFNLPIDTLNGLRNSIKGALENMAKRLLLPGIDIQTIITHFRHYGLNNLEFNLLDDGILALQVLIFNFNLKKINIF